MAPAADARDWSFGGTWPYQPKWLHTDGVRIHYVDEGPRDGEPVVMLHGHPAWSYGDWAARLLALIEAERECCPFFKFELSFEPDQGPVWFHARDSDEIKAFLATLSGSDGG